MVKWEYTELWLNHNENVIKRGGRGTGEALARYEEQFSVHLTHYMNELGNQGWELVGVKNPSTRNSGTSLYFKRPKP